MNTFTCILLYIIIAAILSRSVYANLSKVLPGKVIVLNGPSSVGKSSIQKEFQQVMMPNLWIKLGIDNLFDQPMPNITSDNLPFWQSENTIRWVESTQDGDAKPIITLFVGSDGEKVAYAMNSAIAAYAKSGCNVIVDYIAYKKEWVDDLKAKLNVIDTFWVKVNLPLSLLEERETARGTSPKGHGRSHYDIVHWDIAYDLEVDPSNKSALEIAQEIKTKILK